MGTVYLIDLSSCDAAQSSDPRPACPLAWCCAAELAGWTAAEDVIAAWQSAVSSLVSSHANTGSSFHWLPFPADVAVHNKYFDASVRLVIGCHVVNSNNSSISCNAHDGTDAIQVALQAHFSELHRADNNTHSDANDEEERYGCVFVLDAAQVARDAAACLVPWHVLPSAEACLFRAMLVFRADSPRAQHSTACQERLQDACIEHQCEYITHAAAYSTSAHTSVMLEQVPRSAGQAGLLAGTLCGSARLLQLMHNVLWCTPISCRGQVSTAANKLASRPPLASTPAACNRFLLLCDGEVEDADAALASFVQPQRHNRGKAANEGAMDVRFYCVQVNDCTPSLQKRKVDYTPSLLLLVNRYYCTLVQPYVLPMQRLTSAALQSYCELSGATRVAYVFRAVSHTTAREGVRNEHVCKMLREHRIELLALVTDYAADNNSTCYDEAEADDEDGSGSSASCEAETEHISLRARTPEEPGMSCGYDRLRETLHCVEWPVRQAHRTARGAHKGTPLGARAHAGNRCLVALYGNEVRQEEAWLTRLLDCMHVTHTDRHNSNAPYSAIEAATWRTVPSLYLTTLSGSAHYTVTSGNDEEDDIGVCMRVDNKYFHATVRLYGEGGLRTRLMNNSSACTSEPAALQDALAAMHAVVVVCTAQSLAAAAAGQHARLRTMLVALQDVLLRAEEAQQKEEAEEEGNTTREDVTISLGQAEEDRLAMLYVTDVSMSDSTAVAHVEERVRQVLQDTPAKRAHGEAESHVCWPRFELVFAAPHDTSRTNNAAASTTTKDMFDTHGYARVQEALVQHVWPNVQRKDNTVDARTTAPSAEAANSPEAHEEAAAHNETNDDTNDESESEEAGVSTCALPATYLVDPETLRSVPLQALVALHEAEEERSSSSSSSTGLIGAHEMSVLQDELLVWVSKMKKYGSRLTWTRRKAQAERLAIALEQLDSHKS